MSEHVNTALVEVSLHMALQGCHPTEALLHHSGQGNLYTSAVYQSSLMNAKIQMSMSRVGNCYDNAVAESFFGTLKAECVTTQFTAHALARTTIFEYIEAWYNRCWLPLLSAQPCRVRALTWTLIVSIKARQDQYIDDLVVEMYSCLY